MTTAEYKSRAADAGLNWPTVRAIYDELRTQEKAAIERTTESRRIAFKALGYGNGGQFRLAKGIGRGADADSVRNFDCVARELSATEIPELGADDPSAALWELVTAPAPVMPNQAETMEKAIEIAIEQSPPAPVSPDDLLPLPLAASQADITEQWLRLLVKSGKVRGFRVGRFWLVDRRSIANFQRHPTAGRPRLEPVPF